MKGECKNKNYSNTYRKSIFVRNLDINGMLMRNIIILFFATFSLLSCVPNKNLVYFQGTPNEKNDIQRVTNTPYRLQVDDIINIEIKSTESELVAMFKKSSSSNSGIGSNNNNNNNNNNNGSSGYFSGYSIDVHGNIRLPNLEEINVLGYTTTEVRKKLENEIRKFFKIKNDIFISVKLSGFRYTIFGEIQSPGQKIMYQNRVSIIDAIANAGDISNVGDRRNVEIIRKNDIKTEKFAIDLTKIEAFDSDVFYLKPNDMIYIKPLKQKAWGTGTTGLQSLTTVFSIITLITSTIILARNF